MKKFLLVLLLCGLAAQGMERENRPQSQAEADNQYWEEVKLRGPQEAVSDTEYLMGKCSLLGKSGQTMFSYFLEMIEGMTFSVKTLESLKISGLSFDQNHKTALTAWESLVNLVRSQKGLSEDVKNMLDVLEIHVSQILDQRAEVVACYERAVDFFDKLIALDARLDADTLPTALHMAQIFMTQKQIQGDWRFYVPGWAGDDLPLQGTKLPIMASKEKVSDFVRHLIDVFTNMHTNVISCPSHKDKNLKDILVDIDNSRILPVFCQDLKFISESLQSLTDSMVAGLETRKPSNILKVLESFLDVEICGISGRDEQEDLIKIRAESIAESIAGQDLKELSGRFKLFLGVDEK